MSCWYALRLTCARCCLNYLCCCCWEAHKRKQRRPRGAHFEELGPNDTIRMDDGLGDDDDYSKMFNEKIVSQVVSSTMNVHGDGYFEDVNGNPRWYFIIQMQALDKKHYGDPLSLQQMEAIRDSFGTLEIIKRDIVHSASSGTTTFLASCEKRSIAQSWMDQTHWPFFQKLLGNYYKPNFVEYTNVIDSTPRALEGYYKANTIAVVSASFDDSHTKGDSVADSIDK